MFNSVMAILPWPQPPEKTMSASPKPQSSHIHVHHHITVGPWTILGLLAGMHLMVYAALSFAWIANPASLRVVLETLRPTSSQLQPAGPRPSGDFENLEQP